MALLRVYGFPSNEFRVAIRGEDMATTQYHKKVAQIEYFIIFAIAKNKRGISSVG